MTSRTYDYAADPRPEWPVRVVHHDGLVHDDAIRGTDALEALRAAGENWESAQVRLTGVPDPGRAPGAWLSDPAPLLRRAAETPGLMWWELCYHRGARRWALLPPEVPGTGLVGRDRIDVEWVPVLCLEAQEMLDVPVWERSDEELRGYVDGFLLAYAASDEADLADEEPPAAGSGGGWDGGLDGAR